MAHVWERLGRMVHSYLQLCVFQARLGYRMRRAWRRLIPSVCT